MTNTTVGDLFSLRGDAVSIRVPVELTTQTHSFKSVTVPNGPTSDVSTVRIDSGETWFRLGERHVGFDGFLYLPSVHGEFRNAECYLMHPDGVRLNDYTGLGLSQYEEFTLGDLADALVSGDLTPSEHPDIVHEL